MTLHAKAACLRANHPQRQAFQEALRIKAPSITLAYAFPSDDPAHPVRRMLPARESAWVNPDIPFASSSAYAAVIFSNKVPVVAFIFENGLDAFGSASITLAFSSKPSERARILTSMETMLDRLAPTCPRTQAVQDFFQAAHNLA